MAQQEGGWDDGAEGNKSYALGLCEGGCVRGVGVGWVVKTLEIMATRFELEAAEPAYLRSRWLRVYCGP